VQDNRNRFFLCTALHDTPVPFEKALGLRLGLKKGELRLASGEQLHAALGVAPGAATPVAACAETASRVVVLLDTRLGDAPFVVHPTTNTQSVVVTADALEKLLQEHGRAGHFVDLAVTDFKVGPDSPPDLKAIAATVPEEKSRGEVKCVAAGVDTKKEKKAARCGCHNVPCRCSTMAARCI
jgi:hypothetical protein